MAYRTCPQCGRLFYVPDQTTWAYKSSYKKDGYEVVNCLCRWSCMRKFEQNNGINRYGNWDGKLFDENGGQKL